MLPFKQASKIPVLLYGKTTILSSRGQIKILDNIYYGMFKIGIIDPIRSYENRNLIYIDGLLSIFSETVLRQGIKLRISKEAEFILKENVYIGDNNTIIISKSIVIGKNSRIANNNVFMDTDIHYLINVNTREVKNNNESIEIGEGNWIGSWCTIKKGTKTPNYTTVVGPYSMLSNDYTKTLKEYSVIGGCPAKYITEGFRRINNSDSEILLSKYYSNTDNVFVLDETMTIEYFCIPNKQKGER
jgi:acetyltransferase-like isoleucine patch superfamily enzyme